MAKKSERITVNNMVAFNDALKDEYGIITVTGDAAETVREELKKHSTKQKVSTFLTLITLPLLIFAWPLAVATAFGGLITSSNLKRYKPSINNNGTITLVHKKSKV